jgi:hypothetical protein
VGLDKGDYVMQYFIVIDDLAKFNAIEAVKLLGYDKPMLVTIVTWAKKRTRLQNDLMWSSMLGDISRQATLVGRYFKENVWHEFLKEKFLPDCFIDGITLKGYQKWLEMPDGRLKMIGSTTGLTTKGFTDYLEECYAFGCDLGVRFTENPRYG